MSGRITLLAGLALCAIGVAIAVATAVGGDHRTRPPARFAGPLMPRNLPAADFTLADQAGRRESMAAERGRVVVLTFLHSACRSTCPVSVQTIRGALDDLGPDRREVDVVAVSVDPAEDTPASVRRFVATQHAGAFLRYVSGPRAQLARVWKAYGIAPQGGRSEDHTAFVLLIDRRGLQRIGFPSHTMTSEDLLNDLRLLLAERA